jgi:hypothetical protein
MEGLRMAALHHCQPALTPDHRPAAAIMIEPKTIACVE